MKQKLYNHFKSKSGFTLIELLVVIGILAVLAAIAIPAVAGLINRANISADKTNSNEMTNAVERFASEYELYKNDLAIKGVLPVNEMDAMQGRVYSVIGVNGRSDITELETLGSDNAILINDERYPTTDVLVKKVVEAYTKTSSSTFEPKQSDKCFWYSPECGVVVVAEHNSTVLQKNELIVSGKDAKGNELDAETIWIDLTPVGDEDAGNGGSGNENVTLNLIPEGDRLVLRNGATSTTYVGDGVSVEWPDMSGDVREYKDTRYTPKNSGVYYRIYYAVGGSGDMGWILNYNEDVPTSSITVLEEINGIPVLGIAGKGNGGGQIPFQADGSPVPLTNNILSIAGRLNLADETTLPLLPDNLIQLKNTFANKTELKNIPSDFKIPASTTILTNAFSNCTSLTGNLVIEGHPTTITNAFRNVDFDAQGLVLVHDCGNADCTLIADLKATSGLAQYQPPVEEPETPTIEYTNIVIPTGGVYTHAATNTSITGDGTAVYPVPAKCDTFTYGDYEYTYDGSGWKARCTVSAATVGELLDTIAGKPLTSLANAFDGCVPLKTAPTIPATVTDVSHAFYSCDSLTGNITILSNSLTGTDTMFFSRANNWNAKTLIGNGSNTALLESIASQYSNITLGQPDDIVIGDDNEGDGGSLF